MTLIFLEILVLLLVIFFSSLSFVSNLAGLLFRVFKSRDRVINVLAFFLLPGTFLHEAGHFIFAELLMVRTGDFTVMPKIKSDRSVELGGVQVQQTDYLRQTIIGLAPVFSGLILIWVGSYLFQTWLIASENLFNGPNWAFLGLYIYLLVQISLTMFSSSKDLEGTLVGFVLFALLFLLLKFASEVIVFTPIVTFKTILFNFVESNLFYLRNGLLLSLFIQLALNAVVRSLGLAKSKDN